MTYPTIVSSTGMSSAGNSSPYSVTLPSPINAGNTIVVVLEIANAAIAITPPAGWTEILDASPGAATRLGVYTKTADGTEDGTSISFTNGSTGECKYQAYALDSTTGSVETATGYTSWGANDPPSITPSWSGDTLYLASIFGNSGGNPSAAPSGYSGYSEHENASGDAAIAYKTGSGTENPGAFTASSAIWANLTVAIQGSTATAANNIFFGCNF